jgi:hypothetical protein
VASLLERLTTAVEALAREVAGLRSDLRAGKRRARRDEKPPAERRNATEAKIQPTELDIRHAMKLLRRRS